MQKHQAWERGEIVKRMDKLCIKTLLVQEYFFCTEGNFSSKENHIFLVL